jgi:hypothetical protein
MSYNKGDFIKFISTDGIGNTSPEEEFAFVIDEGDNYYEAVVRMVCAPIYPDTIEEGNMILANEEKTLTPNDYNLERVDQDWIDEEMEKLEKRRIFLLKLSDLMHETNNQNFVK